MKYSDDDWLIAEKHIDIKKLTFYDTIFTIGNGYLCTRGILEESPELSYPGTYFAGIYDKGAAPVSEIVNTPNPLCIMVELNGTKLSVQKMAVAEHLRMLDMKNGLCTRRTLFKAKNGDRYLYESTKFLSIADIHAGGIQIYFTPYDSDVNITLKNIIDGTTKNEIQPVGKAVKHYSIIDAGSGDKHTSYMVCKTNDREIFICFATALMISAINKDNSRASIKVHSSKNYFKNGRCVQELSVNFKKGIKYRIDKIISAYTSQDEGLNLGSADVVKKNAIEKVKAICTEQGGLSTLLKKHRNAWNALWRATDIKIIDDIEVQKALRFNIYHLLIAAPPAGTDASIGAKTLTGEWYKGHVFWDTEIYILPFFVFTMPKKAKQLLMYRYRRLEKARENALKQGYSGALYPWESADTGAEATPALWRGPDGSIIKVYAKHPQHHIAADIAYAISLYYKATADHRFMLDYGIPIVFETARFWRTRVTYNKTYRRYELHNVTGPDEYHKGVNNSSYTNYLAKWHLQYASHIYTSFMKKYPVRMKKICNQLGITESEVKEWRKIGQNILFLIKSNGLIEEFENYFKKKNTLITKWNNLGMPVYSKDESVLQHTQLVKQADVTMLLYLFSNHFDKKTKKINFEYYDARTTHLSTLSPPIHAILASELGDLKKAYKYFEYTLYTDIRNYRGDTHRGIHAASLGGVWQTVINGFAGITLKDDMISVNPSLPLKWDVIKFRLKWRGCDLKFNIYKDKVEVLAHTFSKKVKVPIEIYKKSFYIPSGKLLCIAKKK